MQLGRSLFTAWAFADQASHRRNFLRIAAWMAASGVLLDRRRARRTARRGWRSGSSRSASSTSGPGRVTGRRASAPPATADWDVRGEHIAERCGLFVIICLGETLLISGATFAEVEWTAPGIAAFLVNFLGTVAMWWLYFHIGHERGAHVIEHSDDPGRIARVAFTYAHIPIIAGIVVSAVAAELVIAHPDGHAGWGVAASILGGPALFLVGNLWFKALTARWPPLSHLVGLGLFARSRSSCRGCRRSGSARLALGILVLVAAWERLSLGAAGRPGPSGRRLIPTALEIDLCPARERRWSMTAMGTRHDKANLCSHPQICIQKLRPQKEKYTPLGPYFMCATKCGAGTVSHYLDLI